MHLTHDNIDRALSALTPGKTLDLSGVSFVDTVGALIIVLSLEANRLAGCKVEVISPQSRRVTDYLDKMGLGARLSLPPARSPFLLQGPDGLQQVLSNRMFPVTEMAISHEAGRFADSGGTNVRDELWLSAHLAQVLGTHFGAVAALTHMASIEVAGNVVEHAQAEAAYVVAAVDNGQGSDASVVLAIGDIGVGIPSSLSRRYGELEPTEALQMATQKGVTGTDDPHRGLGLHLLSESMKSGSGTLTLVSGGGLLQESSSGMTRVRRCEQFPGTLVILRIDVDD